MAKSKRLRRLLKVLAVLAVVAGIGIGAALYVMARKDAEHAKFFETGRSVNTFLGGYTKAVKEGFAERDPSKVAALYSERFASRARGRWALRPDADQSDIVVSRLAADGAQDFTRADIDTEVSGYFASLSSVQNVWTKIDMIEQIEPGRRVTLRVKFILDGADAGGQVFEDRNFYRWTLENEARAAGEFDWKVVRDELIEGVRVAAHGDSFRDVTPSSVGIDFKHSRDPKLDGDKFSARMKFDIIEHGSGGVSAADYDDDDRPDIFFPDGARSRLYRNVSAPGAGGVRFEDVTAAAGLEGIDQSNAGLFADVDNDGDQDLFVARYLAPNRFYINNGDGTFADRSREMGLDLETTTTTAVFLDYDLDGYVDLYVGAYGDAVRDIPRLPFFAQNAKPNRLYHNERGARFRDVTDVSGTGDTGWALAVAAADYDRDGYPDIAVANDFGRKCLFHNNGDGTFTDAAKTAGVLDFSGGMGVAFGDFDGDGYPDIYTSNINSNQRWFGEDMTVSQYVRNVARTKWLLLDAGEYKKFYDLVGPNWTEIGTMIGEGNSLFRNNRDGTFSELKDSHTNRAGWSWGVAFFDMDNDTDLDIYAANGWITNKSKDDL
ncbi:MAG TPA: VCBS repeat-containing protein [Pyrinomonadaceae bacterium]|nr:VCBS repeat-containing protein [Pyrinomonadaceae bacterium]